jgi:hypothetical protein
VTDEPNPAAVMANREALLQNLGNIFPISEADQSDVIKLQSWYMLALKQVIDFLKAARASEDTVRGFIFLMDAIGQLRNGTVADVVRSSRIGRGPDGLVVWSYRHEVVIGLECILKSGKMKGKKAAAQHIADNYEPFHRLKRDTNDSLKKSILSWRRYIHDKKVPESEDFQKRQREFFEQHSGLSSAEMYALGEQLLAEAAEHTLKAVF